MPRPSPAPLAPIPNRDRSGPAPQISRAGQKLRAWRKARTMSATEAALKLGLGLATIYRLETGHRSWGMHVQRALVDAGICEAADFWVGEVALCPTCERGVDDPVCASCVRADCKRPRVG